MSKSLSDWLDCFPKEHQFGETYNLDRIRAVAEKMALLPVPYPTIVVTGSNGKGSVVGICETLMVAKGVRVGTLMSPHLIHYNERICVQGKPVEDAQICAAFSAIDEARGDTFLSYFEFSVLAALFIFREVGLDVAILEVGLGGRLDAVNIVESDVAVITAVALEHTEVLGDTIEEIAAEKAGIIHAQKPVIYGDYSIPDAIIAQAELLGAPLMQLGMDYDYQKTADTWAWTANTGTYQDLPYPKGLLCRNAATALMAISFLPKSLHVNAECIRHGLSSIKVRGRFQVVPYGDQTWILDVAHNGQAAVNLAKQVKRYLATHDHGRVLALFSCFRDKDPVALVKPMRDLVDHWYLTELPGERGMPVEDLAAETGLSAVTQLPELNSAFDQLDAEVQPGDVVFVFGSFVLVGAILGRLPAIEEVTQ